jgi:hypothetical protein
MPEPTREQIRAAAKAMAARRGIELDKIPLACLVDWLESAEDALTAAAAVSPETTQEQIEAAARAIWQTLFPHLPYQTGCSAAAQAALKAAAALTPEKDTAPGHTDLMVSPESIEEYFAALPPEQERK